MANPSVQNTTHSVPKTASRHPQVNESPGGKTLSPPPFQLKSGPPAPPSPPSQPSQNSGLPAELKTGIEALSGISMEDVKVHYNSPKPAQVQAHAYTQGIEIHIAPGQEKHLAHEAWHVVQQKQGRVTANTQFKSTQTKLNTDSALEQEADSMGEKALRFTGQSSGPTQFKAVPSGQNSVVQRVVNLAEAKLTENQKYAVHPDDDKVAYSHKNAVPLAPMGLYTRTSEKATDGTKLFKWTPNVKFFSNEQKEDIGKGENMAQHGAELNQMNKDIENPGEQIGVRMPTLGMIGKNDCGFFAKSLQNLIADERKKQGAKPNNPKAPKSKQNFGVGDLMRHNFPEEQACGWHQATAVAKDGASLLTLEGHVGKNLTAPQFHIRNGVDGFILDNDTRPGGGSYNLGDDVDIETLNSAIDQDDPMEDYRTKYQDNTGRGNLGAAVSSLAVARTHHHPDRAADDNKRKQLRIRMSALPKKHRQLLNYRDGQKELMDYMRSPLDITNEPETANAKAAIAEYEKESKKGLSSMLNYCFRSQNYDFNGLVTKYENGSYSWLTSTSQLSKNKIIYLVFIQLAQKSNLWKGVKDIAHKGKVKELLENGLTETEFETKVDPNWAIPVEVEYTAPQGGIRVFVRKKMG